MGCVGRPLEQEIVSAPRRAARADNSICLRIGCVCMWTGGLSRRKMSSSEWAVWTDSNACLCTQCSGRQPWPRFLMHWSHMMELYINMLYTVRVIMSHILVSIALILNWWRCHCFGMLRDSRVSNSTKTIIFSRQKLSSGLTKRSLGF